MTYRRKRSCSLYEEDLWGVFWHVGNGLSGTRSTCSRAQSRMAAGEAGGGTEASTTTTSATLSASSPADLDHRIEALGMELSELKTELAAKKTEEAAPPAPVVGVAATPQDATKPPEKVTLASLLGPTSFSGFVDVYYNWDSNHPADHDVLACSFNCKSDTIGLNMIELILDKAPDPMGGLAGRTGYHVSLGFGEAQSAINAAEAFASSPVIGSNGAGATTPGFDQYIKEAYFSYLVPVGTGLQVDVGKFVTPFGAEVIESKDNWNYSRSLLFNYAIPLNHFGARAKYTFNSKFNMTGYLSTASITWWTTTPARLTWSCFMDPD